MRQQGGQAAIETLADGAEAPYAILAVQLGDDDRFFLVEIGPAEREADDVADAERARRNVFHGGGAVDGGREHQFMNGSGQGVEVDGEAGAAAVQVEGDGIGGAGQLVKKHHVAVVGQFVAGIEAEAGHIDRGARRADVDGHREWGAATEVAQFAFLAARKGVHGIRVHSECLVNVQRNHDDIRYSAAQGRTLYVQRISRA